MSAVIHSFSYNPKEHPRLHAWLERQKRGEKAAEIVKVLERGLGISETAASGMTTLKAQLDRIEARLSGMNVSVNEESEAELPADVVEALNALDF